ncbi:head GIN domain-containing protein [Crocinitomix catalasitica]|uniref:head GIN domain-containing protein n=1 Tax=Crocinitomix catalasitica TaxID=184607 RepID=UPI0004888B74|nr:head GIN domain-containing protein [Crocinitomix catalasitica]
MKNIFFTLLTLCITFGATAGSFEREVSAFNSVLISGNYKVKLVASDKEYVKINNKEDDLADEKIVTEVEGSELIIKIKGDNYKSRNLEITVYYNQLWSVTVKRGAEVFAKGVLTGDIISATCESGGRLDMKVECTSLKVNINAGGSIGIDGQTTSADYRIAAGGTIGAIDVNADNVLAEVKAGGEIICSVNKKLNVKIITGGSVNYRGNPEEIVEDIKLGGKITKLK